MKGNGHFFRCRDQVFKESPLVEQRVQITEQSILSAKILPGNLFSRQIEKHQGSGVANCEAPD